MTVAPVTPEARRPLGRIRRVAGWLANGLVTGAVLFAGLTWGRQLTSWWFVPVWEEPRVGMDLDVGRGLGTSPQGWQHLEFPELAVRLGRQTWLGSRREALQALRDQCRQQVARGVDGERQPGPEELRLLRRTADMTPVEQQLGQWRMYELHEPMPIVVVADWGAPQEVPQSGPQRFVPARVLVWGLAMPAGPDEGQWTLFTYLPTAPLRQAGS